MLGRTCKLTDEIRMSSIKKRVTFSLFAPLLLTLVFLQAAPCGGQTQSYVAPAGQAPPDVAEVTKELEAMKARIEELEKELKARGPASLTTTLPQPEATDPQQNQLQPATAKETSPPASPVSAEPPAPFAYADWTWLNGNPRTKDLVWDSKFFTPEVRLDAHFINDFNHPRDDSMGGSTETFRANEFQLEQISFGGNFHWKNVNARILTMNGMFGVTTPRNDASAGRGQWDLRGAYKYFSEANAGYHFNVNHGLNFDAGIFVSYIGLFSYYNFDNWAYQPSYVSSNTPRF